MPSFSRSAIIVSAPLESFTGISVNGQGRKNTAVSENWKFNADGILWVGRWEPCTLGNHRPHLCHCTIKN